MDNKKDQPVAAENDPEYPAAVSVDSINPLLMVEADIKNLMILNGKLVYELNEAKQNFSVDTKKMLLGFIEIADAFENLFNHIRIKLEASDQQTKIWVNNFNTIYKSLLRMLRTLNVIPIEIVIGEKANPEWHDVIEVVKDHSLQHEIIVEEIKKGYLWNGILLRASAVKSVKNL